jgi:hypothetical protein
MEKGGGGSDAEIEQFRTGFCPEQKIVKEKRERSCINTSVKIEAQATLQNEGGARYAKRRSSRRLSAFEKKKKKKIERAYRSGMVWTGHRSVNPGGEYRTQRPDKCNDDNGARSEDN